MIFVAGVSPKLKQTGTAECICPACGSAARLHIVKQYSVVTLFFIPVIPFGAEYIATCPVCASVLGLPKEVGRNLERNPGANLDPRDLTVIKSNMGMHCRSCGSRVQQDQNFCPKCGERL